MGETMRCVGSKKLMRAFRRHAILCPFGGGSQKFVGKRAVPLGPTSPCKISSKSVPVIPEKSISYDRNICQYNKLPMGCEA